MENQEICVGKKSRYIYIWYVDINHYASAPPVEEICIIEANVVWCIRRAKDDILLRQFLACKIRQW